MTFVESKEPGHVAVRLRGQHDKVLVAMMEVTRRSLFAVPIVGLDGAKHIRFIEIDRALARLAPFLSDLREKQILVRPFHVFDKSATGDVAISTAAGDKQVQQRFLNVQGPCRCLGARS